MINENVFRTLSSIVKNKILQFCSWFSFVSRSFFDEKNDYLFFSHLIQAIVEFYVDSSGAFEFLADFCFEK